MHAMAFAKYSKKPHIVLLSVNTLLIPNWLVAIRIYPEHIRLLEIVLPLFHIHNSIEKLISKYRNEMGIAMLSILFEVFD